MTEGLQITFDAAALLARLEPAAFEATIERAGDKVAIYLEGQVKKAISPFSKTGRLRASITWRRAGKTWYIGSDVSYALPVEEGWREHEIVPRNKKVLAWPTSRGVTGRGRKGSAMAFATRVTVPAFPGHHYLANTLRDEEGQVRQIVEAEIIASL